MLTLRARRADRAVETPRYGICLVPGRPGATHRGASARMGVVNLTDVRAGMVLVADVMGAGARLLVVAGTELTEKHLRMLSMWGIDRVNVEGLSLAELIAQAAAALSPSEWVAVETRVQALFRHNDRRHPVIEGLAELATMRLIRQACGGGDGS